MDQLCWTSNHANWQASAAPPPSTEEHRNDDRKLQYDVARTRIWEKYWPEGAKSPEPVPPLARELPAGTLRGVVLEEEPGTAQDADLDGGAQGGG